MTDPSAPGRMVQGGTVLSCLRLVRYGALADVEVPIGPAVTVIVGANEAGKSTTRAAVGDLLWGPPLRHPLASLLPRAQIRLTAGLTSGPELVRTAGGLYAADGLTRVDHPWGEDGEDGRRAWATAYGLDHAGLRSGGEAVCGGGGDLAELVFAARAGQDVAELLRMLDERADRLYKAHRGNAGVVVRAALRAVGDSRDALRSATTRASTVVAAEGEVQRLVEEVDAATSRELEAARALALAQLLQRCQPDGSALLAVRAELTELTGTEQLLDAAALAELDSATAELQEAGTRRSELDQAASQLREALGTFAQDPALLGDGDAVEALHTSAQVRASDRTRGEQSRSQATVHLAATRQALAALHPVPEDDGPEAAAALLDRLAVPADRQAQLDALAGEHPGLLADVERAQAAHRQRLAVLREHPPLDALLAPGAVAPLREALTALRAEASPLTRWRAATEAARRALGEQRDLLVDAGVGDPDAAAGDPPSQEAVGTALAAQEDAERSADDHARDSARAQGELDAAQAALAASAAPDIGPAVLARLREQREALWHQVRGSWLSGGVHAVTVDADRLADAYAAAVRAADEATDRTIEAADRVADLHHKRHQRDEAAARVDHLSAGADGTASALQRARAGYQALWTAAGVSAPPAGRAQVVRQHLAQARTAAHRAADHREQAEEVAGEVGAWCDRLAEALERAGRAARTGARGAADLEALQGSAEALVHEADAERDARQERLRAQRDADEAEADAEQAASALAAWAERWGALTAAAGLPAAIDPTGWTTRRELLGTAASEVEAASAAQAQAQAATQAWSSFAAQVASLAERHGTEGEVLTALEDLWRRVSRARADERSHADHQRRLAELQDAAEPLEVQAAAARAQLEGLRHRFDGNDAAFAGCVARSRRADALTDEAAALTARLQAAVAPQHDVEEVLQHLAGADAAALELALRDARAGAEVARASRDGLLATLAEARVRLRELEAGGRAAQLRATEQQRLAALAEAAEAYAVTHLQRTVLREQLAAYAGQHTSPLLTDAGRLLEHLTAGRWVGLHQEAPSEQERCLRVVRADGDLQATSSLSEGTADQVFLALRLAGMRQMQAERARAGLAPLPVVLDDVLMTFDDDRARRALESVADLFSSAAPGESTAARPQVLLLTHHEHVGDLARALDRPDIVVTRLGAPGPVEGALGPDQVRRALAVAAPPAAPRGAAASPPTGRQRDTGDVDPAAVRAWALEQGLDVGQRGRLPAEIVERYRAAHPGG